MSTSSASGESDWERGEKGVLASSSSLFCSVPVRSPLLPYSLRQGYRRVCRAQLLISKLSLSPPHPHFLPNREHWTRITSTGAKHSGKKKCGQYRTGTFPTDICSPGSHSPPSDKQIPRSSWLFPVFRFSFSSPRLLSTRTKTNYETLNAPCLLSNLRLRKLRSARKPESFFSFAAFIIYLSV